MTACSTATTTMRSRTGFWFAYVTGESGLRACIGDNRTRMTYRDENRVDVRDEEITGQCEPYTR